MTRRAVAITGTGLVSPLGDDACALLAALLAGERGVRPVEGLGLESLSSQLGGAIPTFAPGLYLGERNFRPLDRTGQLTVAAAAVERAILAALAASGLAPEDLGFLATGASGSVTLDAREADGIVRALGSAAAALPVTAVKAGVGEPLGAGGALQAILAVTALAGGSLPGVVGLDDTDLAIPLGGLSHEPRAIDRRPALLTALDRHGGAHALIVGSGEETGR